ncbi:hypothetical protein [Photobacterium damselae]|uniref:Pilin n=2 Tax=Photobacterium damselae TaxID=38293 RepID=D0Z573_PHODD|nr:hypothetical protein [Photobacterium damselae]EEZ39047.1 hypothetical protein VDA_000032 [Photobacterium damselae subsp. damselae CIP 102761]EEZ39107.1 hypothetical protein VDA_000123 [Photobacterium damselae subsp. damselae CIP 102761]PSW77907.1 hypothetical protein CTN07_21400 [Photobacterium damselae]SPY46048.1 type IV conjugative transfer system pilin TraA [Photobacterium damselae]
MNTLAFSAPSIFMAKNKNIIMTALLALFPVAMTFVPDLAYAADMFAEGKQEIIDSTGKDSTLWFSMTAVGLAFALVLGFTTKNWFAAIGGFFIGMIFMNVAAGFIGLA